MFLAWFSPSWQWCKIRVMPLNYQDIKGLIIFPMTLVLYFCNSIEVSASVSRVTAVSVERQTLSIFPYFTVLNKRKNIHHRHWFLFWPLGVSIMLSHVLYWQQASTWQHFLGALCLWRNTTGQVFFASYRGQKFIFLSSGTGAYPKHKLWAKSIITTHCWKSSFN